MDYRWPALIGLLVASTAFSQETAPTVGRQSFFRCQDQGGSIEVSQNSSGAVVVESLINGIIEVGPNPARFMGHLRLKKDSSRCVIELHTGVGNRRFVLKRDLLRRNKLHMDMDGKKPIPCALSKSAKEDFLACRQPGPSFELNSNSDLTCLPAPDESQDFGLNAKLENLLLLGGLRNYLAFEGRLKPPKLSDLPITRTESSPNPSPGHGCEFQMSRAGYPLTTLFISDEQLNGYHSTNVSYGEGEGNQRRMTCRVSEKLREKHACFRSSAPSMKEPTPRSPARPNTQGL